MPSRIVATLLLFITLSGCASVGPGTVARDRFGYITANSESWKSQMLLNLVKIRYGDAPVFLDVASVINQYAIEGSMGYTANWAQNNQLPWPYDMLHSWTALGRYTDRPTITYAPLSGERFARNLMTPIPPASILNLIQAGYPIDLVLRLCVHSINGISTRFGGAGRIQEADPEFYPLAERMRSVQLSGDLGLRVKKTPDGSVTLLVFNKKPNPVLEADRAEIRRFLGLDPGADELTVVYGSIATNDKEIAMLTRSMLDILIDLSSYIEVPPSSTTEQRTFPTLPPEVFNGKAVPPLIKIGSSSESPVEAFAAVPYRKEWYWIDDRDYASKRLFSFIMFLFTLTETEGKQGAPVITIPAG